LVFYRDISGAASGGDNGKAARLLRKRAGWQFTQFCPKIAPEAASQKPGFPLQFLGPPDGGPAGFPLQSLAPHGLQRMV
jgi:hypothetical protein